MRSLLFILSLIFGLQVHDLHASITSAKTRTMATFQRQCDEDGNGKACYDYARMRWSTPGAVNRTVAKKYFVLGCEHDYKPACTTYNTHNAVVVRHRKKHKSVLDGENSGKCFGSEDLSTAQLTPNLVNKQSVHGQRIEQIMKNSFWARVGLQDGDIIVRVNNHVFNSKKEALDAFASSGKNFGFQVERGGDNITLWYTCQ